MARVESTKKAVARKAAAKMVPSQKAPALEDGIHDVEYGLTIEYKGKKGTFWPKMGGKIVPRPNETPTEARARLVEWVMDGLNEQIEEFES